MKISVLGLLSFLIVVGFSGCASKPNIVTREYCEGQTYPERVSSRTPICTNIKDIDGKAECASKQFALLNRDYDNLEGYIRECVR